MAQETSRRQFLRSSALLAAAVVPAGAAYAIRPGQTKRYRVWEGNTDRHYTSTNGLRAFEIWVPDDHVGDIPYIVGGLQADGDRNFMGTGRALTGRAYRGRIKIVACAEVLNDGRFMKSGYDSHFHRLTRSNCDIPVFNRDTKTYGKRFAVGGVYRLGSFSATPYIWDHGKLADGGARGTGGRRTLAYLIRHNRARNGARTFFSSGFCEERTFLNSINRPISCHHLIFAWNQHELTGESAKKIRLLPDSPVGANYIFANHTDNNSNPYDIDDGKEEVIDMFGMFLEKGVIAHDFTSVTNRVRWMGQDRTIRLGAFYNRLGVD